LINSNHGKKAEKIQVYLYRSVLCKKFEDEEFTPSEYLITDFIDIMDIIEDFVFSNIQILVEIRMNQGEY
jgi:hypothetical protein